MYGDVLPYEEACVLAAGTLIKEAESGKGLLPYTLSLGMLTSLTGLTFARTMERKRCDAWSRRCWTLQESSNSGCILSPTRDYYFSCLQARARDLFYGLWTTDLFMQRVEANADWSLFCPSEAPGLADCWGDEHAALYVRYEQEGRAKRSVKAQQLWFAILEAQVRIR